MFCAMCISAQDRWFLIGDNEHYVDVEEIAYMFVIDDENLFSVVNKDGSVVASLRELRFTNDEACAVKSINVESYEMAMFGRLVESSIKLSRLPNNSRIQIYTLSGELIVDKDKVDAYATIDVSHLSSGAYIISVNSVNVKFIKK